MVTPKCFLCSAPAAAVIFAPHGCTCHAAQTQARCVQHMLRLQDTDEDYTIMETFQDYAMLF